MAKKPILIPFNKDDMGVPDCQYYIRDENVDWREDGRFVGRLKVSHSERGRSSSTVILVNERGGEYEMLTSEFVRLVKVRNIVDGSIEDNWIVKKRGANYRLYLDD